MTGGNEPGWKEIITELHGLVFILINGRSARDEPS